MKPFRFYHYVTQSLLIVSLASTSIATPPIRFLSFLNDGSGTTKVPHDVVHFAWRFNGDPGWDSCFLAIRPILNLVDDNAYVVGIHVQCGASAANLQIPSLPYNSSFPYDGSLFVVRMNTPFGTYSDGNPFRISKEYNPPWSSPDQIARESVNISKGSLTVASIALFCVMFSIFVTIAIAYQTNKENKSKERDTKTELQNLRLRIDGRFNGLGDEIARGIAQFEQTRVRRPVTP